MRAFCPPPPSPLIDRRAHAPEAPHDDALDEGGARGDPCVDEDDAARKVWTVSIDSVEWVEFQNHPAPSGTGPRTFRLTPQEFDANIKFPLNGDTILTLGNAKITQIPVNSNIATTGHKLQGMSKDIIVVNSWNYRCPNWVYVVLSRVLHSLGSI